MAKPPKKDNFGSDYSREREWGVLLEDLQGQFRVFGEGLQTVQDRLERVEDKVEKLDAIESDVSLIKLMLPTLATKKELQKAIAPLATKKDLEVFDRRLAVFENPR